MKIQDTDKKLFAGTGRLLTPEEQKRKMELMSKISNNVFIEGLNYRPTDYKPMKKIELPSDNYEHYA